MAEEHERKPAEVEGEVQDRGLFGFMGKKKDEDEKKGEEEALAAKFEKVKVEDPHEAKKADEEEEEEHKHSLLEKLHDSSSSSSSDEEEGGEGEKKEKKKKKKGLKEKLKEKVCGEHKEGEKEAKPTAAAAHHEEHTTVPVEKVEAATGTHAPAEHHPEEKKGILEKIKEKLPGGHKKTTEEGAPPAPAPVAEAHVEGSQGKEHEGEPAKEKKGLLGKIMDKIPGYHKSSTEGGEHGGAATH